MYFYWDTRPGESFVLTEKDYLIKLGEHVFFEAPDMKSLKGNTKDVKGNVNNECFYPIEGLEVGQRVNCLHGDERLLKFSGEIVSLDTTFPEGEENEKYIQIKITDGVYCYALIDDDELLFSINIQPAA